MRTKLGKKSLILILALSFCMVMCTTVSLLWAEEVPAEVRAAAESGFKSLLQKIPGEALAYFNFNNLGEVEKSVLGEPFRMFTIPPELILNYSGSDMAVEKMISPTPIWIFPVVADGKVRTFITVDLVGGEYQAVSIGSSSLAKEWASVVEKWPPSAGYKHTFVRIYQATSDFILLSQDGQAGGMVALQAARVSLGLGGGEIYNPAQILSALKNPVMENIKAPVGF